MENLLRIKHFTEFKRLSLSDEVKPWKGVQNPRKWATQSLGVIKFSEELPEIGFTRKSLTSFCLHKENSPLACFLAIASWGGMRQKNVKLCWEDQSELTKVIKSFREVGPKLSRSEAYQKFYKFKKNGKFQGMGPAYYTKLIYFLSPESRGYIMDQWLAKSVNLLMENSVVKLTSSGFVCKSNSSGDYENYCEVIDILARKLNLSGAKVEELLFSNGGKNSGAWRKYVKEQSSNAKNS